MRNRQFTTEAGNLMLLIYALIVLGVVLGVLV